MNSESSDDFMNYNNDEEYRMCLRKLAGMKSEPNKDLDAISQDEFDFDEDSINQFLTTIYEATKHEELFQELYEYAAATMISTDPEIGLVVLYSYDYMKLFHLCVLEYLKNKDVSAIERNSKYKYLVHLLQRRPS